MLPANTSAYLWGAFGGAGIEKSGFATMPGGKSADSDVARACAAILANPPTPN